MSEYQRDMPGGFAGRLGRPAPSGMGGLMRGIAWIVLVVLVAVVVVWAVWPKSSGSKSAFGANGPIPVGVATISRGDIKISLNGLGTVTPLATVTVHPQITGTLESLAFREGQLVKAGQLLAVIDPRPYQAALDQAKGQLARDEALLANARTDLERYQGLYKQNAVSQQVLNTQQATVGSDEGTVLADRAAVEAAAVNLSYCRIVSPVTGRVGLRQVDAGNLVQAGGSSQIVVVTQLQPMSVLFSLPEDYVDQIMGRVNAGASLPVAAYDRTQTVLIARGVLANVDNEIDPTTGMFKLRAMFDNKDLALFPSQFVNAKILVDTLHDQTRAPVGAIQRGPSGTYVYVIGKDLTASMRPVSVGATDGDQVQITSGLSVGETVVVDGADRLRDGATVVLPGAKTPAAVAPPPGVQSGKGGHHGTWDGKHGHHHHHASSGDGGQ